MIIPWYRICPEWILQWHGCYSIQLVLVSVWIIVSVQEGHTAHLEK